MELKEAHRQWNIDGDNLMRGWEIIQDEPYLRYLRDTEAEHFHYPPLEVMATGVCRGVFLSASEGVPFDVVLQAALVGIYMLGVEHGSKGVTLTPCTNDIDDPEHL